MGDGEELPRDKTGEPNQSNNQADNYNPSRFEAFGPESRSSTTAKTKEDDERKSSSKLANDDSRSGFLDLRDGMFVSADMPKPLGAGEKKDGNQTREMLDWLYKNFDKLDRNKDEHLTKSELGNAVVNTALGNSEGAVYIATAFVAAQDISKAAADLSGKKVDAKSEDKGFTREDLKLLRDNLSRINTKEIQDRLSITSINSFRDKVDTNEDGTITRSELAASLKRNDLTPDQRASLQLLQRRFSEVAKTSDDKIPGDGGKQRTLVPLTKDGTPDLKEKEFVSSKDLREFARPADQVMKGLRDHLKHRQERLNEKDGQGHTGSCFLLAAAHSLLEKDPNAIKSMIKDNKDGTSTVTFPGCETKVTVANPTKAELATYSNGKDMAILEKAYATRRIDFDAGGQGRGDKTKYDGTGGRDKMPPQEALQRGGSSKTALEYLTNQQGFVLKFPDDSRILDYLKLANSKDHHVVAASKPAKDMPINTGITPEHAYAVVGFDPKTLMVELMNPTTKAPGGKLVEPAGPGGKPRDGQNDGRFKIPLSDFKNGFSSLQFTMRKFMTDEERKDH